MSCKVSSQHRGIVYSSILCVPVSGIILIRYTSDHIAMTIWRFELDNFQNLNLPHWRVEGVCEHRNNDSCNYPASARHLD